MNDLKQFPFYRNYYEIIKYLSPKDKIQLYDAILEYMFEDKEPELKELLKGIWINIKMPLDNNKKNIINGQKGGRPKKQEDNPNNNPKETQTKPNSEPKQKTNNISYFLFLISNNKYKYIVNNNSIYNKIIEWLEYKQERKELYKETGLKSLLSQIENQIDIYGEKEIINLIDECMANNYKGIIFDKLKNKQKQIIPKWFNQKIEREEPTEEELEEMKEIQKKFEEIFNLNERG